MPVDPIAHFPPTLRAKDGRELRAHSVRRTWCRRCKEGTEVAYVADGRGWPLCLRCAVRIEAKPCRICGDTTPTESRAWEGPSAAAPRGRPVRHHESGAVCYPPSIHERYRIHCSSCSAPIRFGLIVITDRIAAGVTDELACVCGARWKLESKALPWMNVYLAA